jgi:hypothetical protein
MTVRYRREGLRVVRVDGEAPSWPVTTGEDGQSPVGDFSGDPTDPVALADHAARLHAFAAHYRRLARRRRREETLSRTLPPSGVTAAQLLYARRLAGLTQRQLAEHLGVGRGSIADMEIERRYVNTAVGGWVRTTLRERGG